MFLNDILDDVHCNKSLTHYFTSVFRNHLSEMVVRIFAWQLKSATFFQIVLLGQKVNPCLKAVCRTLTMFFLRSLIEVLEKAGL